MFGWGDPVKRFWRTVLRQAENQQKGRILSSEFCYKVDMALQKYDRRLRITIMEEPSEIPTLTITADGNADAFPAVSRLSAAAPHVPGWQFQFLQPPMNEMGGVDVDDETRVGAEDVWFRPVIEGDRIDLDLFIRNLTEFNRRYVEEGARTLVLCLMGESDFGARVRSIRCHPWQEQEAPDLHPVRDIRALLGKLHPDDA